VKGHSGLQGNENADYMAKIVASYNPNITYGAVPISLFKRVLEDYYTAIWNAKYTNSVKGSHTKTLIPSIFHIKTQTLWPNYVLTQFLTNHGCSRSYNHKRTKAPSPICSCPEKQGQTALHLLKDCSLFTKVRPEVLKKLTLPQIMQHHLKNQSSVQPNRQHLPHATVTIVKCPDVNHATVPGHILKGQETIVLIDIHTNLI
jgi:hypothetical protein